LLICLFFGLLLFSSKIEVSEPFFTEIKSFFNHHSTFSLFLEKNLEISVKNKGINPSLALLSVFFNKDVKFFLNYIIIETFILNTT